MEIKKDNVSSYRNIVKGTAILGGVQVWNIIIGLLRGKFVALFLGTAGLGIISLFNVACNTVQQFTSLGIHISSVRDIAYWNENGNQEQCSRIVKAVRRSIRLSAVLGALFMALFSDWLSRTTFGNSDYKWSFVFLSLFVAFSLLANGENSILQGFRRLKSLALRNMSGSICGLVIGVPLYYWKGVDGIVPALILYSLVLYAFSRWGTYKIHLKEVEQTWTESYTLCRSVVALGILLTLGAFANSCANYLVLSSIRAFGSINDVGLYNAATSITNQYSGLVFTAMSTDYYPKLCSLIDDKEAAVNLVTQQTELLMLIVSPIICTIIIAAPLVIRILLTEEFMPIVGLVRFLAFAIAFRAFCVPIGYMSVAKNDKKFYVIFELIVANIKTPLIFIMMYYYFSLPGLGYASLLDFGLGVFISLYAVKWRFHMMLPRAIYRMLIPIMICLTGCFITSLMSDSIWAYGLMLAFTGYLYVIAFKELDRRIQIKKLIVRKLFNK